MNPLLKIKVTKADRKRLEPHMTCWSRLNEMFVLGQITLDDLLKMIQIERSGKSRRPILVRLIARYCSNLRTQLQEECLKKS